MTRVAPSNQLLAKSEGPGYERVSLTQHPTDVLTAVAALFGGAEKPSALAADWCKFFGLAPDKARNFVMNVRLSAFCCDWGKANDGCQKRKAALFGSRKRR